MSGVSVFVYVLCCCWCVCGSYTPLDFESRKEWAIWYGIHQVWCELRVLRTRGRI